MRCFAATVNDALRESFASFVLGGQLKALMTNRGATRLWSSSGEFSPNDGRDAGAQNFYGSQHLLMRKRRDTHLERDARDAAENFIHIQYLFRNGFGVADK